METALNVLGNARATQNALFFPTLIYSNQSQCPFGSFREKNIQRRGSDGIAHEFVRNLQQRASPGNSARSSVGLTQRENNRKMVIDLQFSINFIHQAIFSRNSLKLLNFEVFISTMNIKI